MERALQLARRGLGWARPNPAVGAVVVRDNQVVGEGWHKRAGGAHAEVEALESCGGSASGATIYVTLEPCSTVGRTPPCTERIVREGIARVVVGCLDPNPAHQGRGLELLEGAGIEVESGVCQLEAENLIAGFAKHITSGLPYLTLKLGMTLDGRIADRDGVSQWITGVESRSVVQEMRRESDVVMVGAGTAVADNPSLLCRLDGVPPLRRVVVDSKGVVGGELQVLSDAAAKMTIIATTTGVAAGRVGEWEQAGARVWSFEPADGGHVPLGELIARLGSEGCQRVLCEGGGGLAGALHEQGLVDEYCFFYAPAVLGDSRGVSGVAGGGTTLAGMERLELVESRQIGEDVLIRCRRR